MSVFELSGRKALVTGGAQGLGEGMARALADAGATVVIADLQEEAGRAVAKGLGEEHGFVALDVTSDDGWESAIGEAVEHLGGLDILVNNAGIEITSLFTEIQADQVRKMLDVNFLGTALGIKHGLRAMRPGGPGNTGGHGGSIINIASVAATIAFPGIGIYSGTKSAVERMTKVAAMEAGKLGYGVRVNCIFPGLVPTAMGAGLANDVAELGLFASPEAAVGAVVELTPAGRLGAVDDMADAVVFLASDASRFITGAGLPVDGGMGM
ncbi:MAG TPA: SDR family oxidoreductase [Nocardioides sp.]|nr:SDR family oxidoreductase [Nocardioides sp.]